MPADRRLIVQQTIQSRSARFLQGGIVTPIIRTVASRISSERGTIKDRFILTQLPHLVVEGLILGGLVTGAKRGYFFIRHEYKQQERSFARS